MTDGRFEGRVALVTGASGGIGAAICSALGAGGAAVAVCYGRGSGAAERVIGDLENAGVRARPFGADMEQPSEPSRLVDEVERELGSVEILVANHGLGERAAYEDVDAAAFDRMLAINLRAPFLLARRVLPGMRQRGYGRIVFMSSAAAFRGGVLGPHYAASKAGLHGLTYFLASRAAADGVTVNAIAPGFVETGMLPGDPAELGASVPVGRVGRPEEVADLTAAVVANGYLTGHVMSIDGGMHPR